VFPLLLNIIFAIMVTDMVISVAAGVLAQLLVVL
jgi:hypothetical protein